MSYVNPPLVSEREVGVDEDCVPCAALMLALAHHPGLAPATRYEAQHMRADAGYRTEGGTSVEGIARGLERRYKLTPRIATTFTALWAALRPGNGAYVIVAPGRFPLSHPLAKWNGAFHGLHCIYVGRKGWRQRVWMLDPEAPYGVGYTGEWVSKGDLAKAFVGSAGVLALHRR